MGMIGPRGNMVDLDLIDEDHQVYQGSVNVVGDPPKQINALILLTPDNAIWMPGTRRCEGGNLIAYSQLSIHDDPQKFPGLLWLQAAVQLARTYVDAGWGLAILCGAGISRSTMLTASLLMDLYSDFDVDKAIAKVAAGRPILGLQAPGVAPNVGFRAGMREWAAWRKSLDVTAPHDDLSRSTSDVQASPQEVVNGPTDR